jgi:hypothetical protein
LSPKGFPRRREGRVSSPAGHATPGDALFSERFRRHFSLRPSVVIEICTSRPNPARKFYFQSVPPKGKLMVQRGAALIIDPRRITAIGKNFGPSLAQGLEVVSLRDADQKLALKAR